MKVRLGDLRRLIREQALDQDFGGTLDHILSSIQGIIKETEQAHQLAPAGPAKAIVAGIHSDLFNMAAEVREYVEKLKAMAPKKAA